MNDPRLLQRLVLLLVVMLGSGFSALQEANAQTCTITTVAGGERDDSSNVLLGDGGQATAAHFNEIGGIAVDAAGNLYISDWGVGRVRKVGTDGIIRTIAGTGTRIPLSAPIPNDDGNVGTSAYLYFPEDLDIDTAGNLYINDSGNHRIRKLAPDGTITTVAGSATTAFDAGFAGDGGPARSAKLSHPRGIALDAAGNLYIADRYNQRIRKVAPNGTITTYAGSGPIDLEFGSFAGDGGPATEARFNVPNGIAVDAAGNLFVADTSNSRVRKISPDGIITTVAGGNPASSMTVTDDGLPFSGMATDMINIWAVDAAADSVGNLFIAESNRIRKLTPDGRITTFAGNGQAGHSGDGGPALEASFLRILWITIDSHGNVYAADGGWMPSDTSPTNLAGKFRVRKITCADTSPAEGGGTGGGTDPGTGGSGTDGTITPPAGDGGTRQTDQPAARRAGGCSGGN